MFEPPTKEGCGDGCLGVLAVTAMALFLIVLTGHGASRARLRQAAARRGRGTAWIHKTSDPTPRACRQRGGVTRHREVT